MRLITIAILCIVFIGMHLATQAAEPAPGDITITKAITQLEKQASQLEVKQGVTEEVADLYTRIGDLYLEIKQIDKAVGAYTRALNDETNWDYFSSTCKKLELRTKDPLSAATFLRKAPINTPQIAQQLMFVVNNTLIYRSGSSGSALTPEQSEELVDAAEEILTAIAVMYKDDPVGQDAALSALKVRWSLDNMSFYGDFDRAQDLEEKRRDSLREFANTHAGTPIASRARMELADMLAITQDAAGARTEWQAVMDDKSASENDRTRAKGLLAHSLIEDGRFDEAEPLLQSIISTEPTPNDPSAYQMVARALLDMGKVQRKRGDNAAAKASFERALDLAPDWDQELRNEITVAARADEAGYMLSAYGVHTTVYEPQGECFDFHTGMPCTVQDTALISATVLSGSDEDFLYSMLFSSAKPISRAQNYWGVGECEEYKDDAGFHLKWDGTISAKASPHERMLHGHASNEKKPTEFPIDGVSMKVTSKMGADGVVALSVQVTAPEGSTLRVTHPETASVLPGSISPQPQNDWPGGVYFKSIEGKAPVIYEFKMRLDRKVSFYVPHLSLTIGGNASEAIAPKASPTDPVKEITGELGDISYRFSSPKNFLCDTWTNIEYVTVEIPEVIHE